MGEDSIIDYAKLGLEYIFIGIFFILFLQVAKIRDQYAEALTAQYAARAEIQERLEFSMYDTGTDQTSLDECVTGDVVLATLRQYVDEEGMAVYVVDGTGVICSVNDMTRDDKDAYTVQSLLGRIDVNAYYHPYLLYDGESVDKNPGNYAHSGNAVSGIAFHKN